MSTIIEALTRSSRPLKAKEVATLLGRTSREINHCIYANIAAFEPRDSHTWAVSGSTGNEEPTLYEWQNEALDQWEAFDRRGIVVAVTGAGKTAVALEAAARFLEDPKARAVVVVPTTVLLRQWQNRVSTKLGIEPGLCGATHLDNLNNHRVTIYVIHSAVSYLDRVPRSGVRATLDAGWESAGNHG